MMSKPRKSSGAKRAKRNAGIQQARENVKKQIGELQHQMQLLRQQSLNTIQQNIQSAFKNQVNTSLQKVMTSEKELIAKAANTIQNPPSTQPRQTQQPSPIADSNLLLQQKQLTTAALAGTEKALQNALKAAAASLPGK